MTRSALAALFLAHPASAGESYGRHFRFAAGLSGWLLLAAMAAAVHAAVPALCQTTASRILRRLHGRIATRGGAGLSPLPAPAATATPRPRGASGSPRRS